MKELNFDDGLVEYRVNGSATIRFNPTDTEFCKRILNIFRDLSGKQSEYEARLPKSDFPEMSEPDLSDPEKVSELNRQTDELLSTIQQMDKEMRQAIDEAFQTDGVADAVFGDRSLYAYANGFPLWANFLMAVIDEMPASAEEQAKLTDPRLRAYVGKYSKKYAKR